MTLYTPAIGPGMNATDCERMTTSEECFVVCMPGFTASFYGHEADAGNVTCGTDAKFTDATLVCTPMMCHDPSAYIHVSEIDPCEGVNCGELLTANVLRARGSATTGGLVPIAKLRHVDAWRPSIGTTRRALQPISPTTYRFRRTQAIGGYC